MIHAFVQNCLVFPLVPSCLALGQRLIILSPIVVHSGLPQSTVTGVLIVLGSLIVSEGQSSCCTHCYALDSYQHRTTVIVLRLLLSCSTALVPLVYLVPAEVAL